MSGGKWIADCGRRIAEVVVGAWAAWWRGCPAVVVRRIESGPAASSIRNPTSAIRHPLRGFTIIEVIVIVVILGVLAVVIAPRLINRIGSSKQSVAAANAATLATQIKIMAADMGRMPEAGTPITVLWTDPGEGSGWQGPYVDNPDQLKDPWGNAFVLVIPGQQNVDFDVVSYGADGQTGGEGENQDIRKP